jgi:hypothetical protein
MENPMVGLSVQTEGHPWIINTSVARRSVVPAATWLPERGSFATDCLKRGYAQAAAAGTAG